MVTECNKMNLKITVKKMVLEASSKIKVLSVLEAMRLLDNENYVFIDLRDAHELDQYGVIPKSVHAPRGMIEFWIDPESPYHKKIFSSGKAFVFYCKSGWRSALATKTVQDMGLDLVSHIDGGYSAWQEAGCPIKKINS